MPPPAVPAPRPGPGPRARVKPAAPPSTAEPAPAPFTVPDLLRMLVDLGLTTAALARACPTPTQARTVSAWVTANQIPADRQPELRAILEGLKAKKA